MCVKFVIWFLHILAICKKNCFDELACRYMEQITQASGNPVLFTMCVCVYQKNNFLVVGILQVVTLFTPAFDCSYFFVVLCHLILFIYHTWATRQRHDDIWEAREYASYRLCFSKTINFFRVEAQLVLGCHLHYLLIRNHIAPTLTCQLYFVDPQLL